MVSAAPTIHKAVQQMSKKDPRRMIYSPVLAWLVLDFSVRQMADFALSLTAMPVRDY
jgi:hypothetical protein